MQVIKGLVMGIIIGLAVIAIWYIFGGHCA